MAVSNVSFGQNAQNNQQEVKKQTSVLKGTAVAAASGAGVSATLQYSGKYFIPKLIRIGAVRKNKQIRAALGNSPEAKQAIIANCKKAFELIKRTKLLNFKNIAKNAGVTALTWSAIYLGYRGIKALFTSKS